jgi:predicted FMN-binding regulatory protein PaiB
MSAPATVGGMYLPPAFREDRLELQHRLMRERPLALLVTAGPAGLMANLVPFLIYSDEGKCGTLRAHVARANAQWKELSAVAECMVVFQDGGGYITPNWYPTKAETHKVVPTWNYAAVQAWGRPRAVEDAGWLRRPDGRRRPQCGAGQDNPGSQRLVAERLAALRAPGGRTRKPGRLPRRALGIVEVLPGLR